MSSLEPGPEQPLAGRVILIAGALGGLGEATAKACTRAGACVILLGRRVPRLTRLHDALLELGPCQPAIYPLDLAGATPDDYDQLATTVAAEYGRLDAILHCAAEFKELASLENMPLEDWFIGLHVNLSAPYLLTRACLPLLRAGGQSKVLFFLDDPDTIERAYWGSYGVGKQGLRALVSILHDELENSGVRVHGVQPAPMRTRLRGRAFFSENPADVPAPEASARALISILASERAQPAFLHLEPVAADGARSLGLKLL